ncbi:MAG: hypothetical protein IKW52_01365 [Alistipes sp.]|nr:hypothetical protein [Alistipes sp.]
MSDQELRSYKLTNVEDPSDELLEALIQAAGEAARKRGIEADAKFERELQQLVTERQSKYSCSNGKKA